MMFTTITDYLLNTDPFSPSMIAILVLVGFVVGFINTLAGMATALSYVLFMAMGMPINVANGTSRVGVLSQFAVSTLIFKKKGYLDTKIGTKVGIPVAIGSIIGAQLVAVLNTQIVEIVMGILLPIMAISLMTDSKLSIKGNNGIKDNLTPLKFIVFVVVGIYGGFTHAGVGILIIFGSIYFYGLDMLKANAIKQFAVLLYTPLALAVFILHGQVNWPVAFIYAVGNVCGAIVASRVAISWGIRFINWVVAIAVISVSFWLIYKQFR
ncbi:MAG: hypothetical protein A2X18_08985 [Bacteroidetes bacterium GWF2_40_14]|nr:MAG: hypothetical protein A2X18_08985 [Bacteroidetes bacterium GWF2_40_14]